jgi:hypothetical protein
MNHTNKKMKEQQFYNHFKNLKTEVQELKHFNKEDSSLFRKSQR